MKVKFLLLAFMFVGLLMYVSCKKVDISPQDLSNPNTLEEKFFNSHRTTDPTEKALVEFVKRKNNKLHFVEKTVKQIGFPRWDKAVIKKGSSINERTSSDLSDIIYVPFVKDSQNYVNASMIIKTSATDTSFTYACDWQYSHLRNNAASINDTAEYFAMFFMALDKNVFGHNRFAIVDTNLFKNKNHKAVYLTLKPKSTGGRTNLFAQVNCEDVTISFEDCPWIADGKACAGENGSCDHCDQCMSSIFYSYCWTEYVGGGGGGGNPGGGPGPGGNPSGGGGGGGTGGGGTPPDCGGSVVRTAPPDGCGPGWVPDPGPSYNESAYTDPSEMDFISDPVINLNDMFKCFNNISDNGATYTLRLCADLPVNDHPNYLIDNGLHPGHSFITLSKCNGTNCVTRSFGFYPTIGRKSINMQPQASQMEDNSFHEYNASIEMQISSVQFSVLKNKALDLAQNKQYDLNGFNCTNYALAVWNSINSGSLIVVPDWHGGGTGFNYGTTPNGLYYMIQHIPTSNNVFVGTNYAPSGSGVCP